MLEHMEISRETFVNYLSHPLLRAAYALAWAALLTLTLLQSSAEPVVGPAAPPGPPTLQGEALLTLAHVIGFAGLTLLWTFAFDQTMRQPRAIVLAVVIAVILGIVTEYLQTGVPDRNSSLWDYTVNILTALGTGYLLLRRRKES